MRLTPFSSFDRTVALSSRRKKRGGGGKEADFTLGEREVGNSAFFPPRSLPLSRKKGRKLPATVGPRGRLPCSRTLRVAFKGGEIKPHVRRRPR